MIAVACDDGMGFPEVARFIRIKRRVNTTVNHRCARAPCGGPHLVPTQRVARVNPDADDVTRFDRPEIDQLERFVNDGWRSVRFRRGSRQHVQPPRRDHANPERDVAGIYKVYGH